MYAQVEKQKENASRAVANSVAQKKSIAQKSFGFVDNRSGAIARNLTKKAINPIESLKNIGQLSPIIINRIPSAIQLQKLPKGDHKDMVERAEKERKLSSKQTEDQWLVNILQMLCDDFEVDYGTSKKMIENLIKANAIDMADVNQIQTEIKRHLQLQAEGRGIDDQHDMRAPVNEQDMHVWLTTLCDKRIAGLYKGEEHFNGHAQQIQLQINRLIEAFNSGLEYDLYEMAINAIEKTLTKYRPSTFGPTFLYDFGFGKKKKI